MRKRIDSLTGLRSFFIVLLFLHHVNIFGDLNIPGYDTAIFYLGSDSVRVVDFFFVLSGFVIAYSFLPKFQKKELSPGDFLFQRLIRIYPTHLLVWIACAMIYTGNLVWCLSEKRFWIGGLLLQSFIPTRDMVADTLWGNAPSWSMSVNLFFYVSFVLLARLTTKQRKVIWLALFAAIVLCGVVVGTDTAYRDWLYYINPMFRLLAFLGGMLLCEWRRNLTWQLRTDGAATCLEILSLVVLCVFTGVSRATGVFEANSVIKPYYYLFSYLFIVFAFSFDRGMLSRACQTRVFQVVGNASFAFYLVHQPVLYVIKKEFGSRITNLGSMALFTIIAFALSLIVSIFLHYCFEKPTIQMLKAMRKKNEMSGDMKQSRKRWMSLFVAVVFLCVCFPAVNTALIKKDAGPLVGVANEYAPPQFTLAAFRDGSYQKQFEQSFSKGFSGYRLCMRGLNELRFRLFGEVGNTVACKDGSVIFENYIEEYMGVSETHYCTDEYLDQLTAQLVRIRDLAAQQGKQLVVMVTPNKAGFVADQIPDRYSRMEQIYTQEERGAPRLVARMEDAGISYVDGVALLQSQEWPFDVFPETGIHWTREAAMQVLDAVIDRWGTDGAQFKRVSAVGRVEQDEPRRGSKNNDDDVWLLMNIFSSKDTTYTYPIEETVIPENYSTPAVFVQGGSFSYTINELLTDHDVVRDLNFLFYAQSLYDYMGDVAPVTDLRDAAIRQKVQDSDIILLEVNEEAVYSMGAGFYPVLEEILAQSASEEKAFQVQYRGMGPWETANGVSWRWAYGKNAMLVYEGAQPTNTLMARFWVPYSQYVATGQVKAGDEIALEICVNGLPYQTVTCTQDWVFDIQVDSSRLLAGQDNVVEIRSPYTFAANTAYGMKDLSVQVLGAWRAE